MIILGVVGAGWLWYLMDERIAEAAAGRIGPGIDTVLAWDKAIKVATLCMIGGISIIISGFSLGDVTDELIAWFDQYDTSTSQEGTDKRNGDRDTAGTSSYYDIGFHAATTLYGFITLSAISAGGLLFAYIWLGIEGLDDNFTCDL